MIGVDVDAIEVTEDREKFRKLMEKIGVGMAPQATAKSFLEGKEVALTQKEFALLEYLVRNKNKVCRRTRIIESVWDIHFDYNTGIIDVFINSLRKKLQLSKGEDYIQTIRGVGYMAKDR